MARAEPIAPPLAAKWRSLAEDRCEAAGERLTPARLAAYAEMLESDRPVSAYELIALLEDRQKRKIAPLTVYRHLDFLIRVGLVHRIESTQSYTTCEHPQHSHQSQYLICSTCGKADEVESKKLESVLDDIAGQSGFEAEHTVVEIKGKCATCTTDNAD